MRIPIASLISSSLALFVAFSLMSLMIPDIAWAEENIEVVSSAESNVDEEGPSAHRSIINEEAVLEPVAQTESTASFFLAHSLESSKVTPMVSAKVSFEDEDAVVGSFFYRGITYAMEPGGKSVAVVSADLARLPQDFLKAQTIVLSSAVSPNGIDFYSVTRIADGAFSSLTRGAAVSMPETSSTRFESGTFAADDGEQTCGITAITIPASISTIEEDAFAGFETLQYVIVSSDSPDYSMYDGCLYDKSQESLLLIPEGRLGAVRIAPSAVALDPEVFSHCPSLDSVIADADSAAYQLLEGDGDLRVIDDETVGDSHISTDVSDEPIPDVDYSKSIHIEKFEEIEKVLTDRDLSDEDGGRYDVAFSVCVDSDEAKMGNPIEVLIRSAGKKIRYEVVTLTSDASLSNAASVSLEATRDSKRQAASFEEISNLNMFLSTYSGRRGILCFWDAADYEALYKRTKVPAYNNTYTTRPGEILFGAGTHYPITFVGGRFQSPAPDADNFGLVSFSSSLAGGITSAEVYDPNTRTFSSIPPGSVVQTYAQSSSPMFVFLNGFRPSYLTGHSVVWDAGCYGSQFDPEQGSSTPENGEWQDNMTRLVTHVPLDENGLDDDLLENVTNVPAYDISDIPGFTFKGWASQKKDDVGNLVVDEFGNRVLETEYIRYDAATNATFTESCADGNYLTEETGQNLIIEEDTTFYAVFVADVTFDGGTYGGRVQKLDENGDPIEGQFATFATLHGVPYGNKVALPAAEEKGEGWTFQGWATKNKEGVLSERDTALTQAFPEVDKTTFYAVWGVDATWRIDDDAKVDGIVIEGQGSDVLVDGNVLYGTTPREDILAPTSRRGYVFKGWRSSIDNGLYGGCDGADVPPTLKAPCTFVSEWEAIDYKIAFDVDGGYVDGYEDWTPESYEAKVNLNGFIELPGGTTAYPVPARYGYAFSGWYVMQGEERVLFCDEKGVPTDEVWTKDGDGTLLAAWTPKAYKIVWMFNYVEGGQPEGSYETTQTFDSPLVLPIDVPSRPGFSVFDGWFEDRMGKVAVFAGETFAPSGLEDRYGKPEGGNTTFYYASFSGAESFWVKLVAGEGGRFGSSDGSYNPDEFRYAFSSDEATPVPIIMAGEPKTIELRPTEQSLSSRISDYVFAGWAEVEGSWDEEGGFRSIEETIPNSVYERDTTLPDGSIRFASTLRDDTIPEEVMGNRTFVALWKSESVPLALKLGDTSLGDAATPVFDENALKDIGFQLSEDGKSASFSWDNPYASLDLSAVTTCEGYRLVGFKKEGADGMSEPLLLIEATPAFPGSAFAGTYVACWEAEERSIVFHDNHHHDGASSERDTLMNVAYDEDVVLPYPSTSFPSDDSSEEEFPVYGSFAFKWWGTRSLETNSAHAAWKADAHVPFHEIVSQAIPDEDGVIHLYAQWVSSISVVIPLYVSISIDPDQGWADILVGDGEGGASFMGLESSSHALFKIRSVECESVNAFTNEAGATSPLVTDPGSTTLSEEGLFLTVRSERTDGDGTVLPFDIACSHSAYVDGITSLEGGGLFDASRCGFAVSPSDPAGPTRIPLRFGLSFGDRADGTSRDVTDFRFADLVSDDPDSKGILARVRYTIEAL